MAPQPIQSEAFDLAALRSERLRIAAMIAIASLIATLDILGGLFGTTRGSLRWLAFALPLLGLFVAYECVGLWIVNRALRERRPLKPWLWVVNTIIENSLPTIAMFGLTIRQDYLGPYRALASPAVVVYCVFIVLSTLRLSPALCVLAGAVSTAGYVIVLLYTRHHFPDASARSAMPGDLYVMFPFALFVCGVVAATVARQIRKHVVAALAEAETRRRLDRVEHDLQTARSIQMGLLPRTPPAIDGYDIAGWSQPADQTGGDYYDWIELPDGHGAIFVIADATGHGIGPALLIAACRAYFRATAAHVDPLEQICAQVDALVAADVGDGGRFITAAVALLDPQANRLSLYSAGHAPTYFFSAATDEVNVFDANQPPLGMNFPPDEDARPRTIEFAPGDALVFVTDGLFECANPAGELFGIRPLAESIRAHHAAGAAEMIRRIHADVCTFAAGAPQGDDRTAVVIRRRTAPVASAAQN